ncbi:MAG: polysaccharide biosynthesis/export family protein [Muribaculaceae bacterium]|nr:polysaccharide biosynthesis/export family protein [Muribaculaceae bacterium]MDE6552840.1 polysaccharide biosynthesis/export family protein [Muribaculaceae bacterium]
MKIKTIFRCALSALVAAVISSSCSTPKNIAYFQGMENADIFEIANTQNMAIKVRPHDKLSIIVSCKDPALAKMFNLEVFTNSHVNTSSPNGANFRDYNVGYNDGIAAYTVSADGTIDFPVLGILKVEGMTRSELAGFVKGEIMGRGYIKDPVVTVEFLNTGISMLGDINRPGRYDLNTDVLTVVEAISLAGDIGIQGRRDNIKVLRKNGDKVETYIIDMTDPKKLYSSPAYYMQQGDIVYVEPNDIRKRQTIANGNSVTNISFWISIASLLTSAALLVKN